MWISIDYAIDHLVVKGVLHKEFCNFNVGDGLVAIFGLAFVLVIDP